MSANEQEERLSCFMNKYPQFQGKFIGWTKKDGLGISRIDNRWYESSDYLISSDDLIPAFEAIAQQRDELLSKVAAQQARIDELMLEYCPDEMTQEQIENWGKHQQPVEDTK